MLMKNGEEKGDVIYVPSPVQVLYNFIYSIEINRSGRLQYYKQPVNRKRIRITKGEFSKIYNTKKIIAIDPVQDTGPGTDHFLLRIYTI
jgi:hypothetical protein